MSIREALKPKSDQLNADDLLGNITKIITITNVTIKLNTEQPIIINYNGDDGKPWKPCKSMGRILLACWGDDESKYIGRSVELFRDDSVRFGSDMVGGIRIKSLSDIPDKKILSLQVSRGKRARFIVDVLKIKKQPSQKQKDTAAEKAVTEMIAVLEMASEQAHIDNYLTQQEPMIRRLSDAYPDKYEALMTAIIFNQERLTNESINATIRSDDTHDGVQEN